VYPDWRGQRGKVGAYEGLHLIVCERFSSGLVAIWNVGVT
jgi:hypothetical protein